MFKCNPAKVISDEEIGKGAFGIVYPYQKNSQDNKWIVKCSHLKNFEHLMKAMQEVVLGLSCIHPAILPLRAYYVEENKMLNSSKTNGYHLYIKMPRMKSNLRAVLNQLDEQENPITEEDVVRIFHTLASGLEYLHGRSIAHRDIKPENILIDGKGHILISDIGSGVLIGIEDTGVTEVNGNFGTIIYKSPEALSGTKHLKKEQYFISDMWSLGAVIAELCSFKRVYGNQPQGKIAERLDGLAGKYSPTLVGLISSLLRVNPHERKSAAEIKKALEDHYPELLLSNGSSYQIRF